MTSSSKPEVHNREGASHGQGQHVKIGVQFGHVVFEICKRTNEQTYSSQYFASLLGANNHRYTLNWIGTVTCWLQRNITWAVRHSYRGAKIIETPQQQRMTFVVARFYLRDAMLARLLAVVECLCVSVTRRYCIETAARIELIFFAYELPSTPVF